MKKIRVCLVVTFLALTFIPAQLHAGAETLPRPVVTTETKTVESAEATVLINRLNEINTMDKSNLNSSEKRQLRKEVRSTNKQLRELHGGVYLSVGAIIIIILLLIILL